MGGAVSVRPGIVIDLRSMHRIRGISTQDRSAWVEAGVVLKDLSDALEQQGFILGHDPWSLPVATVGGAISTNGLGYLAGRYGSMGDQVLALTVVLPDGGILRLPALPAQSVGINLSHLFIGAEGTMGIITEAVLRIFPKPERRRVYAFAFPSFEAGLQAVLDMLTIGMRAAIADYGDYFGPPSAVKMRRGMSASPEPPTLYLVLEGFREEVEAQEKRALAICRRRGGGDLGREEATRFWRRRHRSGERFVKSRASGRRSFWAQASPNVRYEYLTVVVPASRVLQYRQRCLEVLARNEVHLLESGFWGAPELFALFMVKVGRDEEGASEVLRRVTDEVLMLAQDFGGAIEQCHGVGLRRAHLMTRQHGHGLAVMRQMKRALDPYNIMNPGKLALDSDGEPIGM
jgi:alkyldihydroxyacetonephosphate synthase